MHTTVNRSDRPDAPYSSKTADRIDRDGHLWEVIALVTVLILALVFRLWGLDRNWVGCRVLHCRGTEHGNELA